MNLLYEEFEDTKGVIRVRKSKNDRQHKYHKKKDKRTNNDLQIRHIEVRKVWRFKRGNHNP